MKLGDRSRLPESAERRQALAQQFGADFTLLTTDHFLVVYNTERAHQGRGMNGRTPHTAFFEGLLKPGKKEDTQDAA